MAIFSCNHSSVGKSTHASGTAGAHLRYITRPSSKATIFAEHMPENRHEARAWMNAQELSSRKNERMIDKIIGALPRELNHEQQNNLVQAFAKDMSQDRAPWYAAIHREGKDANNPHVHFVLRDRDSETGKKVAQLSSKGSTDRIRQKWEHHVNQALERAGLDERVDRRSLKAQGIDRKPSIHVSPKAHAMENKGQTPCTKAPRDYEPIGSAEERAKKLQRMDAYRRVSRMAHNARISAHNALMLKRQSRERRDLNASLRASYGPQKAIVGAKQQEILERLEAKGLKRLARNITGKTKKDQLKLKDAENRMEAIKAREKAKRTELERKQAEERRRLPRQAQEPPQRISELFEKVREQNNQNPRPEKKQSRSKGRSRSRSRGPSMGR